MAVQARRPGHVTKCVGTTSCSTLAVAAADIRIGVGTWARDHMEMISALLLLGGWIPLTKGQPWWRHQMETFSALLALCAGNSPVTGEFPSQRPVTRSFDVFFDLRLNKRLSKQSRRWWFETPSCSLWRHCNGNADHSCFACCWPETAEWTVELSAIWDPITAM